MSVQSLTFLGVHTSAFDETVRFYRDIMQLRIIREGRGLVWFELGNGVEVHVYGPDDQDHEFFGPGPVVGLLVDDFDATRARMLADGIEFIGPVQRSEHATWNHYRGPDGNIYEIMSRP